MRKYVLLFAAATLAAPLAAQTNAPAPARCAVRSVHTTAGE
ncbi:MAG: hypothetical protein ACREK8_06725 [Gemmatimonadales bacterium]